MTRREQFLSGRFKGLQTRGSFVKTRILVTPTDSGGRLLSMRGPENGKHGDIQLTDIEARLLARKLGPQIPDAATTGSAPVPPPKSQDDPARGKLEISWKWGQNWVGSKIWR